MKQAHEEARSYLVGGMRGGNSRLRVVILSVLKEEIRGSRLDEAADDLTVFRGKNALIVITFHSKF